VFPLCVDEWSCLMGPSPLPTGRHTATRTRQSVPPIEARSAFLETSTLSCCHYLRSFSTQNTCPGGRRWVDTIPLLDGHFTPDGSGFAVTDVAGQV